MQGTRVQDRRASSGVGVGQRAALGEPVGAMGLSLVLQRRATAGGATGTPSVPHPAARHGLQAVAERMARSGAMLQRRGGGRLDASDPAAVAAAGVGAAASALPHVERIQESFGHHDVSGVRTQVGGHAAAASDALGAVAYATGGRVAFKSAPDLHTAAHEAAHVVQQRGSVQLKEGVGHVGDPYERHADAVADLVVQGKSAEALLDASAGATSLGLLAGDGAARLVQYKPEPRSSTKKLSVEDRILRFDLDERGELLLLLGEIQTAPAGRKEALLMALTERVKFQLKAKMDLVRSSAQVHQQGRDQRGDFTELTTGDMYGTIRALHKLHGRYFKLWRAIHKVSPTDPGALDSIQDRLTDNDTGYYALEKQYDKLDRQTDRKIANKIKTAEKLEDAALWLDAMNKELIKGLMLIMTGDGFAGDLVVIGVELGQDMMEEKLGRNRFDEPFWKTMAIRHTPKLFAALLSKVFNGAIDKLSGKLTDKLPRGVSQKQFVRKLIEAVVQKLVQLTAELFVRSALLSARKPHKVLSVFWDELKKEWDAKKILGHILDIARGMAGTGYYNGR